MWHPAISPIGTIGTIGTAPDSPHSQPPAGRPEAQSEARSEAQSEAQSASHSHWHSLCYSVCRNALLALRSRRMYFVLCFASLLIRTAAGDDLPGLEDAVVCVTRMTRESVPRV